MDMTPRAAGVMITDGEPHPAWKWAEVTASQIIQVAETAAPEVKASARRLELKLLDALERHHDTVQQGERKALGADPARLKVEAVPSEHISVDEVVADLQAAAVDTPWEEHFTRLDVVGYLRVLLTQHFGTSMEIERGWARDGAPVAPGPG